MGQKQRCILWLNVVLTKKKWAALKLKGLEHPFERKPFSESALFKWVSFFFVGQSFHKQNKNHLNTKGNREHIQTFLRSISPIERKRNETPKHSSIHLKRPLHLQCDADFNVEDRLKCDSMKWSNYRFHCSIYRICVSMCVFIYKRSNPKRAWAHSKSQDILNNRRQNPTKLHITSWVLCNFSKLKIPFWFFDLCSFN